jgi:hypothetical protein
VFVDATFLPKASLDTALQSINSALRATRLSAALPAGEYLAAGLDERKRIIAQPAPQVMRADLLTTATTLTFTGDVFCPQTGCVQPPPPSTRSREWAVGAEIAIQWQYMSTGDAATSFTSPSYDAWSLRLILTTDGAGTWQLDRDRTDQVNGYDPFLALDALVCRAGANYLDSIRPSVNLSTTIIVNRGLEGCEIAYTGPGGAQPDAGTYLWRFGVLLATDTQAQDILPGTPLALASAFTALGLTAPADT